MTESTAAPTKKALIAVNLMGFMSFLMDDIDILQSLGYEVTVAADCSFDESRIIAELTRRGAKYVDIRGNSKSPLDKSNIQSYKSYKALIDREGYSAIICHTPITGLVVRLAAMKARAHGCKVIYMTHGLTWTSLSPWKTKLKFKSVEMLASRLCDAIITINEDDRKEASRLLCKKVFKIDGVGCDLALYTGAAASREDVRHELGISPDKIMVFAIGELSQRKNHMVIARALAMLPDRDRYTYVIAGRDLASTGIPDRIKSFCAENGVDVRILGFRNDVSRLVHAADIGVIPSEREGLGMAGIQQLCAGVPMVGTAVQGIKEYVIDGVTGFTVASPYDAAGFADAISRLADANVRQSMAADCVAITEKFSKQRSISRRKEIYSAVLG